MELMLFYPVQELRLATEPMSILLSPFANACMTPLSPLYLVFAGSV